MDSNYTRNRNDRSDRRYRRGFQHQYENNSSLSGDPYANNDYGNYQWYASPQTNYLPNNYSQYGNHYRPPFNHWHSRASHTYRPNDRKQSYRPREANRHETVADNRHSVEQHLAGNPIASNVSQILEKVEKNDDTKQKTYYNSEKPKQKNYEKNYGRSFKKQFYTNGENKMNREDKSRVSVKNTMKLYENDETQREIMDELLRKGEYECMVCCEEVKIRDSIWNCSQCFNIFHLKCIKTWATSSLAANDPLSSNNWRCPACQTTQNQVPNRYFCFCLKTRDPELNRYIVPHSCGEMCARKRKKDEEKRHNCPHKCTLLCHPGPCPPCTTKIARECACGRTKITVKCDTNDDDVICNNKCGKLLNCGQHYCEKICHIGNCGVCEVIKNQTCFCGKDKREVNCSSETSEQFYSCNEKCGKLLKCGHHWCELKCHRGDCESCAFDQKLITHCPCGKTELTQLAVASRKLCTDPIPVCKQLCGKELSCGPKSNRHACKMKCHSGACERCDQKTVIRCRCGANSENVDCTSLTQNGEYDDTFSCKKRCNKKRKCGRHKCLNECCIDETHECDQICGKKLSCNSHTCQELCHFNNCPQCWNISWEELSCNCGAKVIFPPIHCGTKPPECDRVCSRVHSCTHPVTHLCHDDQMCPPCTHLVTKPCYGNHEQRSVIPCYQDGFSCGFPCMKPLACGLHNCQKVCHTDECGECTLPCTKVRQDCGHTCGVRCHQLLSQECPKSNCKIMVKVSCECGRKTDQMYCYKVNDESSWRLPINVLANARIKRGESISINDVVKDIKDFKYNQLKCDEKCAIMERNKQLAEALDISDADFSPDPGPPKYSDMLKDAARDESAFVGDVYDKLSKLVLESKQSKMNFKNLNFPPMNSNHRHVIHELAEFFGCKTHAIDREPNRSVVVKAAKDKCYLPTVSLLDFVKDDKQTKKTNNNKTNKITLKSYCFDQENVKEDSGGDNSNKVSADKQIDYFDFIGD